MDFCAAIPASMITRKCGSEPQIAQILPLRAS